MRRIILLATLAVAVVGIMAGAGAGAKSAGAPGAGLARAGSHAEYVPGELIVQFRPSSGAVARTSALAAEGARTAGNLGRPGLVRVKLPAGTSVEAAAADLADDPSVLTAEPNYIRHLDVLPNDPNFRKLYGLSQANGKDIDAPSAWNATKGSANVVVAVLDSGVSYNHPDLANNIWVNDDPAGGGDDDGNGFVDDTRGWDFVQNDNVPLDFNGHGTHVAGTIGAQGNNNTGVTGVNWDVSIMPVRAADASGSLSDSAIINGINYACANGADVVNGSFGGSGFSAAIANAIKSAACANTLFVFAAGNDGHDLDGNTANENAYPCEYHRPAVQGGADAVNIICVAATDANDHIASFSNHGTQAVHLAAPGVNILSTWPAYSGIPSFPTEGYEGSASAFNSRWGDRTGGNPQWNRTSARKKAGTYSLADSPGGNYPNGVDRRIRRLASFSLAGRAGCIVDNWLRLDSEFGIDFVDIRAGTTPSAASSTLIGSWTGSTSGGFFHVTDDLSDFDGMSTVYLTFGFFSDSSIFFDGAYIDNTSVKCLKTNGAAYNTISGTSMATPHVAGVAALALANNPGLTVAQLKDAILNGLDTVSGLATKVITSGRLNAAKALGLTPDDTPPNTTITGGPSGQTGSHKAKFTFTGAGAGGRFECKHMNGPWEPCSSPKTYKNLSNGNHKFQVRAIDSNGNADKSPATRNWRVV